ncbi:hypothetical protein C1J01_28335 [Nonomuraea aridisoli]|uniref:DUF418 domain-containing protein n=2 Tax=Nonomuraea aridisoli TaxID=2070368 RepID=A0A2W2EK96_9ACTN|nr:hypothetical protein C1J01_28335 [Nonomuraea aridisoli]
MLLAIAFAHAPLFVTDVERGPSLANEIAAFFHMVFVNNHARPLFAFLFGYSLVQLLNRRLARGEQWVSARKLLRRRGWWLVAIGFAHVVLFVPIDILATYGLAAVLLVGLLRRSDRALLWTAGLVMVPATLMVGGAMGFPLSQGIPTFVKGSIATGGAGFGELLTGRLMGWPFTLAVGLLMVVPGVLIGMWAGRRGFLDEPARHRSFLTRAAVITTALSVAGSVPAGLIQAGWWTDASGAALWAASFAQPLTGYAGGIGMAAIVALVAIRAARGRGRLTTAVEALGQRSMSFYLFQSVAFVLVFYPYGLMLEDDLGLAHATAVGAATWLVSLLIADVMRRAGHRGPAEILLRRLAYRNRQDASGPR